MTIVGFIETQGNMSTMELFNYICLKNDLIVNSIIKSDADIITIKLNYSDFLNKKYNFINFDILIFENCGIIEEKIEKNILNSITNENILVINSDDRKIFKFLNGIKSKLITYGLNSKACITDSSIKNENDILKELQCCIQRTIPTLNKTKIEPQEFKVILKKYKSINIYSILAAVSVAIICGIPINSFSKTIL